MRLHDHSSENPRQHWTNASNGKIRIVFLCLLGSATVAHGEQYLCVAEHASGFSYYELSNGWRPAEFSTQSKYVVSASPSEAHVYEVKELGKDRVISRCKDDFDEWGYLDCHGIKDFKLNRKNLRFLAIYPFGYVNVLPDLNKTTDKSSDTPSMQIGFCSKF